jgi:D-Tyr-tRNAtyr deacylase
MNAVVTYLKNAFANVDVEAISAKLAMPIEELELLIESGVTKAGLITHDLAKKLEDAVEGIDASDLLVAQADQAVATAKAVKPEYAQAATPTAAAPTQARAPSQGAAGDYHTSEGRSAFRG